MRQIQDTHIVHNNHIIRYKGQYEIFNQNYIDINLKITVLRIIQVENLTVILVKYYTCFLMF